MKNARNCAKCKSVFTPSDSALRIKAGRGYSYCGSCRTILRKADWLNSKSKIKNINRNSFLKSQYGISVEDYDRLLKDQKGSCAICGLKQASRKNVHFTVDHCHITGKIRGLLCFKCNSGLGYFNDNREIVFKAYIYLKRED